MNITKKTLNKIFTFDKTPFLLNKNFFSESAVLIPLIKKNGKYFLLYQIRAENIPQGGEISFPGGKIDEKDGSFVETALRETKEELGIEKNKIKVFGYIGAYLNPTGALVHAILGELKIKDSNELKINKSEVKEIFTVPLEFLLKNEPEKYSLFTYVQPGISGNNRVSFPASELGLDTKYEKKRKGVKYTVYLYRYNDKIIWGLTAFFTKYFIDRIKTLV